MFKDRWFRHVLTSNHVLICSDRVRKSMRVQYGTIDDMVPIWCSRLMSQPSPHSENPAVAGTMAIHIPSWGALSAWSVFGVERYVALLIRWRRDDNGPETWTGWWLGTWMEKMTFPSYWECHHPNWRSDIFRGDTTKQWKFKTWISHELGHEKNILPEGRWCSDLEMFFTDGLCGSDFA